MAVWMIQCVHMTKETTPEFIDRSIRQGMAGLGIIIALVVGAVWAGWTGVIIATAAIAGIFVLKKRMDAFGAEESSEEKDPRGGQSR